MTKHMPTGRHLGGIERKDDSSIPSDIRKALAEMGTAFEEFKSTNDSRLKEIEKKGAADPLLADKISKIEKDLDKGEDLNQRLASAETKAAQIDKLNERFDNIETMLKRTGPGQTKADESRVNDWARGVIGAHTMGIPNLDQKSRDILEAVRLEHKALAITPDTAGGYLAPTEYVREIIKAVIELSSFRDLVRVRQTAGRSIVIPARTGVGTAKRVGERGPKEDTGTSTYGQHELVAPEMYALFDVTNHMLEDAFFNIEAEALEDSSEQFAVKEGQEFVSGDGVLGLQGILVAPGVGESNSGHATQITADGLIDLKYGLKTLYSRNATFLMNRTTLGAVRKLKDNDGQYLWQPGLAQGRPNTIDGDPYREVPDMPNIAAGTTPVTYGDYRRGYTMVERLAMEMLRDPYTQATSGEVRFILRRRVGGKVTLGEAFRKLRIGA